MTHAWKQTIEINESIASQVIANQHNIQIDSIKTLDAGWDNVVCLVNQNLIFRFPRREPGLECMENEVTLVPYIQDHVSFALSAPKWIGTPSALYPYLYAGYPMLAGKPLSDTNAELIDDIQFAKTLASWLRELHQVPVTQKHIDAVKGGYEWKVNVKQRTARCEENLGRYKNDFIAAGLNTKILQEVIQQLKQWHLEFKSTAFVHGDLYSRHIMIDEETCQPSGVIDWGDVHIGHPGVDLSAGMIFTPELFQTFLSHYGRVDDETYRILLFNSFCHSMSFLPYAFEQKRKGLMDWATIVLNRAIDEINSSFK